MEEAVAENITEQQALNATLKFTMGEQITAYGTLYGMTLLCIVVGSIRSLEFVQKHIRKKRLIDSSITVKDAKKFPLTASCVLFGLYIFFKCDVACRQKIFEYMSVYLPSKISSKLETLLSLGNSTLSVDGIDELPKTLFSKMIAFLPIVNKANVMYLLLVLLCWEGCVALAAVLKPAFSYILRKIPIGDRQPRLNYQYLWSIKKAKVEMEEGEIENASVDESEYLLKVEWDSHDVVAILCCLCIGISHLYQRHWISNDLLAIAFSIYGIENIHLCSFKAGLMLLAGLFIYDIFWVFATDVMTTVAKGIDAPILLQFPQDIYRSGWIDANKYAMLGLGDIVIPGIFIALLLRFDNRLASGGSNHNGRHYFLLTIIAYAVGLSVTMAVMHVFKAAQPALLYLVPACVLVPLSVACIRGEVTEMLNYCEEHLIEKRDEISVSAKKTD